MRTRIAVLVPLLAVLPAVAATASAQETPIAIEHVNVITMLDTVVHRDQTVLLVNGTIQSLGPSAGLVVPSDAFEVDGTGRFLIPGLMDAHIHILDANDLPLLLTYGITSAVNMSGDPLVLALRDSLRSGSILGPALYTTGPQIKPEPHPLVDFVEAPSNRYEASRLVAEQAAAGYDLVKVWGSLDHSTLAAVIHAADSLGIRVTGHLSNLVGLEGAASLGQSSIAHIEELINKYFNHVLDENLIPLAVSEVRRGDMTVVTTIVTYDMIVRAAYAPSDEAFVARDGFDLLDPVRQLAWRRPYNGYRSESFEARREYYKKALAFQEEVAGALEAGGVALLAGSDAGLLPGLVPGLDLHRELELLVDGGLSTFEALETATRNPGRYLATTEQFGIIAPGARADLVLLDRNPLEDIRATRTIRAVVAHGRYLDRTALDGLLAELRRKNARTAVFVDQVMEKGVQTAAAYADSVREATDRPGFELMPPVILAVQLAEAEHPEEALTLLRAVTRSYPEAYFPEFLIGQLELAAGDNAAARRAFRRVLELEPGHADARRRLAVAESDESP